MTEPDDDPPLSPQPQRLRELLPDVLDQLAETAAARRVHPHPDEENDRSE